MEVLPWLKHCFVSLLISNGYNTEEAKEETLSKFVESEYFTEEIQQEFVEYSNNYSEDDIQELKKCMGEENEENQISNTRTIHYNDVNFMWI